MDEKMEFKKEHLVEILGGNYFCSSKEKVNSVFVIEENDLQKPKKTNKMVQ